MTGRTKGSSREYLESPVSPGARVSKTAWRKHAHLSDEELAAKGIPLRMIRRLRSKDISCGS